MSIARKLTGLALMSGLFISLPTAALAVEDSFPPVFGEQSQGENFQPTTMGNRGVSYVDGKGLKLETETGDNIEVVDNTVYWKDVSGNSVATISLNSISEETDFSYDSKQQIIAPTFSLENSGNRCAPKWVAWGWNVAWDGLVCLPIGVATIAGGFVCGAAGSAIATGMSC